MPKNIVIISEFNLVLKNIGKIGELGEICSLCTFINKDTLDKNTTVSAFHTPGHYVQISGIYICFKMYQLQQT